MTKKNQRPIKNAGQSETQPMGQSDYTDPCVEGEPCFEGDQRTFVTPFVLSELRIPADRLSIWVAQELVSNPAGMNADWWDEVSGSKEVRPVIKRLRDRGWPIEDVWEHTPTPRLPHRHSKTWYLTPEHRIAIAKVMYDSGLMGDKK